MARPLRIEFPGALYHVMARGDGRQSIFRDDEDREAFLTNLGRVCGRFRWRCWAYCLMGNHYHLLIETQTPTLSRGMREVNGVYTQTYNRRHRRVGHVLQGRYKATLVDKDSYLLEVNRYIVLNPVRAKLCRRPQDWTWSSYRATAGKAAAADWVATQETLALFHSRADTARSQYAQFVAEGLTAPDPFEQVRNQLFLGSEVFVERMLDRVRGRKLSGEVPRRQRLLAALPGHARLQDDRDRAIREAYASGDYTLQQIGARFKLHYSTVSRIARQGRGVR